MSLNMPMAQVWTAKESVVSFMTDLLKTFSRERFPDSQQRDANQPLQLQFPQLQFILDSTDRIICFQHRSYYNLHLLKTLQNLPITAASSPPFAVQQFRPSSIMLFLVGHVQPYHNSLLDTVLLLQIKVQAVGPSKFPSMFCLPGAISRFDINLITPSSFFALLSSTYLLSLCS